MVTWLLPKPMSSPPATVVRNQTSSLKVVGFAYERGVETKLVDPLSV